MKLTYESALVLHNIEVRQDQKNYIVEDVTTGEFYEMPLICIDAITMIQKGLHLREVEEKLQKQYPEEDVDMLDFAQQLLDLELVQAVDGEEIVCKKEKEKLGFSWISPKVGRFFFNQKTMLLYTILFVVNIALFIVNPSLLPNYKDLFVFDVMTFNILVWASITFFLVFIHEMGHVLAIRAHDFPTKVEFGHRLFFVVLETDMSSVWKLPAKERNILYLAGMSFDTVILFIAVMIQILFPIHSQVLSGILALAVFDTTLRMVYQCCIYMKTDLYYVFENMTACYNLMENGKRYIKGLFVPKFRVNNSELFTGEEKVVRFYGLFYVIGVTVTIALAVLFYIPQSVYMMRQTIPNLQKPVSNLYFWDAAIIMLQTVIMLSLLLYSWRKKYRNE
ncbi:hypothetical protein AB1283_14950 [Bacillus sp. S13(2024)]|uniref:hypothetical protein n=1 Tax=unclassified Bacillus (in: firmicutes) TaxID=185979 RepID=UPI003D22681A